MTRSARSCGAGIVASVEVDHQTDDDDVAERPEPRTLAKREPEGEDAGADDDRPRADAEPELPRQPLVKDVPGIDAEAAEEEQAVTEAVQGEPEVELAQSPERAAAATSMDKCHEKWPGSDRAILVVVA